MYLAWAFSIWKCGTNITTSLKRRSDSSSSSSSSTTTTTMSAVAKIKVQPGTQRPLPTTLYVCRCTFSICFTTRCDLILNTRENGTWRCRAGAFWCERPKHRVAEESIFPRVGRRDEQSTGPSPCWSWRPLSFSTENDPPYSLRLQGASQYIWPVMTKPVALSAAMARTKVSGVASLRVLEFDGAPKWGDGWPDCIVQAVLSSAM